MKRAMKFGVFGLLLLVGFAWAAPMPIVDPIGRWVQGQLCIGSNKATSCSTANQVTRWLGASSVIDFASSTITTVDSAGITVTGALAGDPCFVGPPSAIVANASFTCYVSAADTVKVRFTPAGTAADPLSGTFFVRVISSQ